MCGIAGIIQLGNRGEFHGEIIRCMTETIKHRGPDEEGYFLYDGNAINIYGGDKSKFEDHTNNSIPYLPLKHIKYSNEFLSKVAFGFRRLSIIDLSPFGHQPMSYMNRYWIVFNGEIYNYLELKAELEVCGYIFNSKTDTEVIMAAYDKWGAACLNKFNGMWAFVILDIKEDKVFLSRDRFGIKPLYYYQDEERFVFASEIKAILANPNVKTNPNITYIKDYLKRGSKAYLKETAFENIYSFNSASFLEISIKDMGKSIIKEEKYWTLKPNLKNEKFSNNKAEEYSKRYYELLSDSVRLRMRSDVKIGTALSGGLDSSSIVHLVNQHLKKNGKKDLQETFSNVYSKEELKALDESDFINTLVNYLKVKSHKIEPQIEEIASQIYQMIYMMDNPPDGSAMSGWYVYKCVAETDIKVMLDGQGADEQLAGYTTYFYSFLANGSIIQTLIEFWKMKKMPGIELKLLKLDICINLLKKLIGQRLMTAILEKAGKNVKFLIPLNELLVKETTTSLMTLLQYGDRLSMAHSIESRVPFMDYRLVEFIANLPVVYKIHNGWSKYISRLSMKDYLPDSVIWRKDKMGFPNADEYWFRGKLKNWFINTIEKSEFLKQIDEGKHIEERMNSEESLSNLTRLLIISIWFETFFSEN